MKLNLNKQLSTLTYDDAWAINIKYSENAKVCKDCENLEKNS